MAKLTVNGKTVEAADGKRLVLAIEDEGGVAIGHRCGGNAACTTCRVAFEAGEPESMTRAEYDKLVERDLLGTYRLSCQMLCADGMRVTAPMTAGTQPVWNGKTGDRPADEITPEPDWGTRERFEG